MSSQVFQGLFVNSYSFTFATSLGTAIVMFFITTMTLIGIRTGSHFIDTQYTGDIHVIAKIYDATHSDRDSFFKLQVVFAAYVIEACLIVFLSVMGLRLIFCSSNSFKGKMINIAPLYFSLVSIALMTNCAVAIWARMEARNLTDENVSHMLRMIQNDIDTVDDGANLNSNGQLFHQVQRQFGCCGVEMPYEWNKIRWFREKYADLPVGTPIFPCFSDKYFDHNKTINYRTAPCSMDPTVPTLDCTLEAPNSLHGCSASLQRHIFDYLCRLTRVSLFLIVIEIFQVLWLLYLCRCYKLRNYQEVVEHQQTIAVVPSEEIESPYKVGVYVKMP